MRVCVACTRHLRVSSAATDPHPPTHARTHPPPVQASGFKLERTEMTGTNFYFSRLLEAVRVEA